MNMSEFPSGLPYGWPIQFSFPYPTTTPIPPFQQYIQTPQDIQIIPGLPSPQRPTIPSTFYPPQQFMVNNRDCVPKRERKVLQIIDPSTKEEICVERDEHQTGTDSLPISELSNSPKLEKFRKQQEFRQQIASAAIKEQDLSPENKIKDEFKFKVSEALTPPFQGDELFDDSALKESVNNLEIPQLSSIVEIPSMEFPNSSLENTLARSSPEDFSETLMNIDSPKICNPVESQICGHCEYSRDTILCLQPDSSSSCDIPGEIALSNFYCISISELFCYDQQFYSLSNLTINPSAKSREKEKMIERLTWILNRITPENYEKLSKKAIDLVATAETISDLENFIHCIFSKSINEPIYCEFYARLCNDMAKIFIRENTHSFDSDVSNAETKQVTFRRCLLTICQQEFEKDKNDNEQLNQMKMKLESCADILEKSLLDEEYHLKEKQVHKHSLGNVRLIGQLYRLNMLSENIIHECTVRLLKGRPTDDYLEELCSLFNVVGVDIDKPEAKDRIDQYFERIQHLMNRGFMSTRVKYLLMNLIDLRLNGWCERREKEIPKTLEELHNICPSQSLPCSLNQQKEHTHGQLLHKNDHIDPLYSSGKFSTSRLPSLKKHSNELNFRPSGNWSNQYQDMKDSFKFESGHTSQPTIESVLSTPDGDFPSSDKTTDFEVIKASTSILKEYDHLNDFDEVRGFLLITYSPPFHSLIICGFFLSLNVTGGKLKSTLIELLVKCCEQEVICEKHIIDGLINVIKRVYDEDIQEDCPLIFEFIYEVLFSIYSQIRILSLVSLINHIYSFENDFVDTIHLFLKISYEMNGHLLVSMIANSEHLVSNDILNSVKNMHPPLYKEIESNLYLPEEVKNKITHLGDPFCNFTTQQMLVEYFSNTFTEMNITNYMKPLFIVEVLILHHSYIGKFELLHWLFGIFSSALVSTIPSHFHLSIILYFFKNINSSSWIVQGDNLKEVFSSPSFQDIITKEISQAIFDSEAVCFPIKTFFRSKLCT